jgi:hypothetical protein
MFDVYEEWMEEEKTQKEIARKLLTQPEYFSAAVQMEDNSLDWLK